MQVCYISEIVVNRDCKLYSTSSVELHVISERVIALHFLLGKQW